MIGETPQPRVDTVALPWETHDLHWIPAWTATCAQVLRSPTTMVAQVGPGRLTPAIAYALGVSLLLGTAAALRMWHEVESPALSDFGIHVGGVTLSLPIYSVLAGGVLHGLAVLWGGRAHFSVAIRIALYSSTAWLLFTPVFLLGNTPASGIMACIAALACFMYGQRVTLGVTTRWYGLPPSRAWPLWGLTVAISGIVAWLA